MIRWKKEFLSEEGLSGLALLVKREITNDLFMKNIAAFKELH